MGATLALCSIGSPTILALNMTDSAKEKLKVQVWVWARPPQQQEAKVLLLKMQNERGGFWQPVTGSVEPEDVSLEAAAEREFREETGLEPLRAPKALGFEFTFPSRWGGTCRESVFEVEVSWEGTQGPRVKIDPSEHTSYQWLEAAEAKKLLQFESNAQPLELLRKNLLQTDIKKPRDISGGLKAWLKKTPLLFLVASLPSLFPSYSLAAQKAVITREEVSILEKPRSQAHSMGSFAQGEEVLVSDQPVRDRESQSWYKVKTKEGRFGYIPMSAIELVSLKKELAERGIDSRAAAEGAGWTIGVRALGLGVYQLPIEEATYAIDAEVSTILGFGEKGFARRRFGVGLGYFGVGDSASILATLISRIYTDSRGEPEIRLRAGLNQGQFVAGFAVGYRWPFSLVAGAHVSGYVEASGLSSFPIPSPQPVGVVAVGTGLAFHF
jgi:8-oxo-dGTP pyrophosphatase MutT (NUDIX family)